MSEHLNCGEMLYGLSDYIDGEAKQAICDAIEAHMAECPDCRVMVDTLRKTIHLYRQQDSQRELPEDVRARLFYSLDMNEWLDRSSPRTDLA
ncbi:MAG: zf-HC2 domain-containing protein [Anaerolineales bacterium]|jgi:predicted anti-sigma-YlaC factor YlaD